MILRDETAELCYSSESSWHFSLHKLTWLQGEQVDLREPQAASSRCAWLAWCNGKPVRSSQWRPTTRIIKLPGLAAGRPVAPGFCSSNSNVGKYAL